MIGTVSGVIEGTQQFIVRLDGDQQLKRGEKIDVELHREKRSLNANGYFHILCSKLAEKLGNSNAFQKNLLIRRYGQYEYVDGKIPTYLIKSEYDEMNDNREDIHLNPIDYEYVGGEIWTKYCKMRGSHTYNTKEMARLIDGTVDECKRQGIDTLTPDEIGRMMQLWERNHPA